MKKVSKLALGLLITGLAIGFSAFNNAPEKSDFTTYYYGYSLSQNKYIQIAGTPDVQNCEPEGDRCVIQSTTVNKPELTLSEAASLSSMPGSSAPAHYFN